MSANPFRNLPSVTEVLAAPAAAALAREHGHGQAVAAVRAALDVLRQQLRDGTVLDGELTPDAIAEHAAAHLAEQVRPKLRPVINATGIVLHTNLGRAPMAEA